MRKIQIKEYSIKYLAQTLQKWHEKLKKAKAKEEF